LDTVAGTIQHTIDEQSLRIGESWQTKKLHLAPGDILLDCVCKRFGVRFKKGVDGPRLASFMAPEDIDPEIKRIIRELGSTI
jgi:hypothetical protein